MKSLAFRLVKTSACFALMIGAFLVTSYYATFSSKILGELYELLNSIEVIRLQHVGAGALILSFAAMLGWVSTIFGATFLKSLNALKGSLSLQSNYRA